MARKKLVGSDVPSTTTRKKAKKKPGASKKSSRKKPAKKPSKKAGPVQKIDARLARSALEKQQRGETPTVREAEALRRMRKQQDEDERDALYASMPKGDYCRLSGRQPKVLNEQADRYGLPLRGRTVDLGKVLTAVHDLLAKNRHRISSDEEDEMLRGPDSDGLERYRHAKAEMAELDLAVRRGETMEVGVARLALASIFETLRQAGEQLRREFGPAAAALIAEAVVDAANQARETFGDDGEDE